ncbi:MAG: hypothetical protein RJB38_1025 [Pseudomonadota bacterium]|jgi:hypothetical protein
MTSIQKRLLALSAWVLSLAALTPSAAYAIPGLDFGIMGGATLNTSSNLGSGSGGLGYSFGPSLGVGPLEVSALYTNLTTDFGSISTNRKSWDIPVLMRFGAGPVGLGLGGFYSITTGSGTSDNYGATASLRMGIPGMGLFADGRYNLGLKDFSGAHISSAALMIGLNFL